MKIVAISDIHNREVELPAGDVLIIAGDLTSTGTFQQLQRFNAYLATQAPKFKHKPLVVAGNHDFIFEQERELAESTLTAGQYIEDETVVIDGVSIFGSPWTPTFFDWAFMKDRGDEIREYWELIPEGLDILVTHGPPWGILDFCGTHAGCSDLLDVVTNSLKQPPKYHIFGHIHEGFGEQKTPKTMYMNVSVCNVHYQAVNAPTVFEINK